MVTNDAKTDGTDRDEQKHKNDGNNVDRRTRPIEHLTIDTMKG